MKAIRFALGSFLLMAFFAGVSQAQFQRTFVSGLGNDGNPCTRTAPCRTFTQAIMGTNAGGEVVALDSAGYGAFTITKAITVDAPPGVYAGISVFSADGIDINAGGSDTVILRGLTINNQGSAGSGVVFNTGARLHVEGCVVNGFSTGGGVSFNGPGNLEVKDSIMRDNNFCIVISSLSSPATATIDQVRMEASINGLTVEQSARVTVRNSVASNNSQGFQAFTQSASGTELNIENCVASGNINGVSASSTSTGVVIVRISNSTVTDNQVGLHNFGSPAVLLSRGNNTVEGNTVADTFGTIGSYTAK